MIDSTKKQAGAELKNKKGLFWAKILINLDFKGKKLTNSQKKKGHYRPKKQAGAEIQKKKDFFGQKL